ncbi:kinase-like domain-containing protein [Apiospora arundinis]|uniref:Kinase-like domain-containing protein n=1 Tax=Apiospora arundinis TaxID=335852 RepID=A0ABR2JIK5_9PEZI
MSSSAPTPTAGGGLPLRSAMKPDDDSDRQQSSAASLKAVQIAEPEPEAPTPEETQPKKQFSAGVGKRLSGRPPIVGANSSRTSLLSQSSLEMLSGHASNQSLVQEPQEIDQSQSQAQGNSHHRHRLDHYGEKLISQVAEWLEHERLKKEKRKGKKHHHIGHRRPSMESAEPEEASTAAEGSRHQRKYSIDSQSSDVSLDRLQRIIDDSMSALGINNMPTYSPRLSARKHKKRSFHLHRAQSSDTEYHDGDVLVPSCDAVLDNSKTMSYSGGKALSAEDEKAPVSRKEEKGRRAWATFKTDVIRIAHTLRIKGWRRVPLDSGNSIEVERLSGALTNAVYVVSPPKDMASKMEPGKTPPAKLLLRVYGPQVENIIDRENELGMLRRLARKKIGPRLLGTFENGRFEQFFNAITLTPAHLREPETSKKIAKRMRELHDGIDLLENEKDGGPSVLKNWDQWLDHVEKVATFLDNELLTGSGDSTPGPADEWKSRGFVCGAEWATFKQAIAKYREWLFNHYNKHNTLRDQLVFAHNDTQYGNILRLRPEDEQSPLMQPQNEHKQLIVIDFEYAGPNTRGHEFANHFTEWTYNYHDATTPHICNTERYPTPDEQRRFLKAYVEHQPQYPSSGTPRLLPLDSPADTGITTTTTTPGSTSSIVEFMLDARVPPGGWREDEKRREEQNEQIIKALMEETKVWRIANSAQWVAWGLMQAKIPGLDLTGAGAADQAKEVEGEAPAPAAAPEEEEGQGDEFDYLGYAQDRAYFFWGDCVQMGIVKLEDLPENLRGKIKSVDY